MDDLYFRMTGSAFDEGYRLDKTINGLSGLQHLMDGVYKGVSGKNRITKKDREIYKLVAYDVQHGSLLVTLGAIYSGMQQALPLFYSTDPESLWEYTKSSVQFLYDIYTKAHDGKKILIQQNDEGVAVATTGDGNETHIYQGPVYQIGTQIINGLRELDDTLENDLVNGIYLGSNKKDSQAVALTNETKGIFNPPITVDTDPKCICCDIFDFNKYDKVGKLHVSENQSIPTGKYRFKVVGKQEVEEFILSMTETQVEINCLVEYEHDPLSTSKIGSLLIVDIAA
jgi:hypothetical protein